MGKAGTIENSGAANASRPALTPNQIQGGVSGKFHHQEQGQDWSFPKPRSVKPEVVESTTIKQKHDRSARI